MQVYFKNPELEKFIDDEVRAGHFPSPDAAIEAAVERMMLDHQSDEIVDDIDDETAAKINRAQAQFDRGEGIDFDQFAAEMRKKLARG
jgi:Arc/MetJ-type ribon-helix-helix transcriptional regulator